MKNIVKIITLLFLIITCTGCLKKPALGIKNLKPLTSETARTTNTNEQVTAYSKRLTYSEQELIFGQQAQQLKKYNIIPVQLTLENNSKTCWVLKDSNILLSKLKIDEVNAKLFALRRWRPLWIFLGGAAAALVVFPIVLSAATVLSVAPISYLHFGGSALAAGLIASGAVFATTSCIAIVDDISAHTSKKHMRQYLKHVLHARFNQLEP